MGMRQRLGDRRRPARRSRGADPRRADQRPRPAGHPLGARPGAGPGRRGRAVLISSHLLSEVAQSVDDVVVIAEGRLRASGPLDDVLGGGGDGSTLVRTAAAGRARPSCSHEHDLRRRAGRRRHPARRARRAARARRRGRRRARRRRSSSCDRRPARSRTPSCAHREVDRDRAAARRAAQAAHHAHLRGARRLAVGTSVLIAALVALLTEPTAGLGPRRRVRVRHEQLLHPLARRRRDQRRVAPPHDHQLAARRARPAAVPRRQDRRLRHRRAGAVAAHRRRRHRRGHRRSCSVRACRCRRRRAAGAVRPQRSLAAMLGAFGVAHRRAPAQPDRRRREPARARRSSSSRSSWRWRRSFGRSARSGRSPSPPPASPPRTPGSPTSNLLELPSPPCCSSRGSAYMLGGGRIVSLQWTVTSSEGGGQGGSIRLLGDSSRSAQREEVSTEPRCDSDPRQISGHSSVVVGRAVVGAPAARPRRRPRRGRRGSRRSRRRWRC